MTISSRDAQTSSSAVSSAEAGRPWLSRWSLRHALAIALLTPLWFVVYRAAVGAAADDSVAWTAGLVGLALLAAMTVATYLPSARRTSGQQCAPRSPAAAIAPCAATPVFSVALATIVLTGATATPVVGVLALVLVLLGLGQRLLVPAGCGR